MNKNILALFLGIILPILGFTAYFGLTGLSNNDGVGVELPEAPALFESSLASPITSSASSFTLTANSVRGGGTLSGYNCFTIDEGSAQAEFVCGTASGTAVTNVTRGISPSDGQSEIEALKFSHRRGASVQITDFPIVQLLRAQNNGDATFENVLQYAGSVVPSSANDLADVGYVLSVVNGGAVNFDSLVVAGNAGETVATGTLVYFDATDQEWKKVDTDTSTTYVRVPVGITQGAGTNGNSIGGGGVLIAGRDTTQTGLTLGDDYYAGSTAGALSTTESGLLIGRAGDSATELYVWPVLNPLLLDNTWSGINTFTGATTTFTGAVAGAVKVNVYTSSGTWTKPTGAAGVEVFVIGAGGGGGGGYGTGSTEGGGAGGGAGGWVHNKFNASELASSVAITVGTGGPGGAGTAGAPTAGTAGGNSSFGTYLVATGGAGGTAGTNTGADAVAVTSRVQSSFIYVTTPATNVVGASGVGDADGGGGGGGVDGLFLVPTGGGGGGDRSATAGGAGGDITGISSLIGGTGGTGGSGAGGTGNSAATIAKIGSGGGGGGGSSTAATGGVGGTGGNYGGGGGGGGASASGTGGAGGPGAGGVVVVITY